MTSPILWGSAPDIVFTLPNPRRDGTSEGGFTPVGSMVVGPDNDVFTTLFGYIRTISYSFHNLSQDELNTVKNAYRTYSMTPTNLQILTGEVISVIAPEPLRWGVFYDRFHIPHYALTINWRIVPLAPALSPTPS